MRGFRRFLERQAPHLLETYQEVQSPNPTISAAEFERRIDRKIEENLAQSRLNTEKTVLEIRQARQAEGTGLQADEDGFRQDATKARQRIRQIMEKNMDLSDLRHQLYLHQNK